MILIVMFCFGMNINADNPSTNDPPSRCEITGNVEYRVVNGNAQFKNNNNYAVDVWYDIDGKTGCHVWLPANSNYKDGECGGNSRITNVKTIACKQD